MAHYHSLREVRIASTSGHVVVVKPLSECPGGTYLPPELYAEAAYRGCVPVGDDSKKPSEGVSVRDRSAAIDKAVLKLVSDNDQSKFTKDGLPKAIIVTHAVGFPVKAEEVAASVARINDNALETDRVDDLSDLA